MITRRPRAHPPIYALGELAVVVIGAVPKDCYERKLLLTTGSFRPAGDCHVLALFGLSAVEGAGGVGGCLGPLCHAELGV